MEHSLLHGLQLTGLIVLLGGSLFVLGLLQPVCRQLGPHPARDALASALASDVARRVSVAAVAAGLATLLDLFVQVAETQGRTPFGGVDLKLVGRFATETTVGQLALARTTFLLLAAITARMREPPAWSAIGALGVGALWCTSLASHAAAQPSARIAAIAAQVAHVGAAAAWIGVLAHLLAARSTLGAETSRPCLVLIAEMVRRFSPVALASAALLLVSGAYAAASNLHTWPGLVTSAYGLTLLVKLVMVLPILMAGAVNYRVVRPSLQRLAGAPSLSPAEGMAWIRRFGQMLEVEVTAGVLVITLAGVVGSIPPPGADGALMLPRGALETVLTPRLPRTTLVDPTRFVGAATRTVDDLRYAELTHNWSGILVTATGLLWLAQGVWARSAALASWGWPFLLVALAVFVSGLADPEVWVLRTVTLRQAILDPSIVEHQLGALLVLALAWLSWRDRLRPAHERPLGHALPLLMIAGGLLLLGHAHTSARETEGLGTLISVQHAILGGLGLLAGTVRWLSLRRLVPERPARILWPLLVTATGCFLAFCYRELV